MHTRELVTSLPRVQEIVQAHRGQTFAFDVETTGLSFHKDRLLGLALTFESSVSYYICLSHTEPTTQPVERVVEEQRLVRYDEEEYFTPKRKIRKTRQVPVYEMVETVVQDVETLYPTRTYIEIPQFIETIQPLFLQPEVVAIAHNMKFDLHFLTRAGLRVALKLVDTMLAAKLINENREVGLKKLSYLVDMRLSEYKGLAHYPGFGKEEFLGVPLDAASTYAMMDTEATYALWEQFQYELVEEGVDTAFTILWMPLMRVLQEMEAKGIAIDHALVETTRQEYIKKRDHHERAIVAEGMKMVLEWYGDEHPSLIPTGYMRMSEHTEEGFVETPDMGRTRVVRPTVRSQCRELYFNPASNVHLGDLLYRWYKLEKPQDVRLNTTTDEPTDKTLLKIWQMSLGDDCPAVINDILEYKAAEKFLGTYLERLLRDADETNHHTIYPSFTQHIADTGRLSSFNPNAQNIPSRGERGKQARSLFVARPKKVLVVADYSSMELRMAAHYAARIDPNHTMIQAFNEGLDLHAVTASQQFGVSYDDLLEKVEAGDVQAKLQRMIGKTSNFGLLYGMGARKFQTYLWVECGVHLPYEDVQELIVQFNNTYLTITEWKQKVIEYAKTLGYVQTIGKRKRRLPDLRSHDPYLRMRAERQAVNAVIQGSCADIMANAIITMQPELKQLGGSVLLQVHDEVVTEVPEETAQAAKAIIEDCMTRNINPYLKCPLVVEAGIGANWGAAK